MTVKERVRAVLTRVPGGLGAARLTLRTVDVCLDYRVTGLAAEAAFFMLLSLPPLVLGLFGGLGYISAWIGPENVAQVVATIREYAARFLTENSISQLLVPTVDDVLRRGRPEIVSLGFLLSLWSGSRALNVFLDTVSIMYGQKDVRGIIRLRALSLAIYTVSTVAGIVLLPLVLLGPALVSDWLPEGFAFLRYLYWPTVLVLSVVALTTLYHVATPRRAPWVRDVPGALLALAIWLGASYLVRVSLEASLGGTTIYGPLTAPIVLLIWLYFLAIAILIGAGLNAASRTLWPVQLGEHDPTSVTDWIARRRAEDRQYARSRPSELQQAVEHELDEGVAAPTEQERGVGR
ncbi:MAG: YihY/virulence factor BrkB family protein [Dermatophilaceae bacterium]|nr:YihY/virulence factor BrkB family protein [Dermatophilaceae bacterium]